MSKQIKMKYNLAIILILICTAFESKAQLLFNETSAYSQDVEVDIFGIGAAEFSKKTIENAKIRAEFKVGFNYLVIETESAGGVWTESQRYKINDDLVNTGFFEGRSSYNFTVTSTLGGNRLNCSYSPGQYLTLTNTGGTGKQYNLNYPIPSHSFQKVTANYLLPDGNTFYAFNSGVAMNAWIYSEDKVEDFKYIYPLDYDIIENGNQSRISFGKITDYSAIMLEKKTVRKGDTIVLEIANVLSEEKIPKKALKHAILYPQGFKVARFTAAAKGKWQQSDNLLLFEAEDAVDGSAKIYFLKDSIKKENKLLAKNKIDTVFVVKNDTVFITKEVIKKDSSSTSGADLTGIKIKDKGSLKLKSKTVEITVWDAATADGDIISINLNGNWIVQNLKLNNCKNVFVFDLQPGENTLIMKAENLGTTPPNTAKFQFKSGNETQVVQLKADMGYSEQIKLMVEE